ncbi:hypothetical protein AgCh_036543 [Apium graveolens]
MCEVAKEYFTTLFTWSYNNVNTQPQSEHRVVSEAQNRKLTEEFSFEKFTFAIKQMHPNKASGPDGLNPAFFQNFWTIMGQESAFVEKRSITDNVLVAIELIHYMNWKKHGSMGEVALKLDVSKNYDRKSGVYFSVNARRDKQEELSTILGVHNDLADTKYLGLPSVVGSSKKRVFNYLKDKASKPIQTWQYKPILQDEKTVLTRNVALAIPSYRCWNYVNMWFDWSIIEHAHEWLLTKISAESAEIIAKICVILWGVWFWRNKRLWEGKVVTPAYAMESSLKMYSEWHNTKQEHRHGYERPPRQDVKDVKTLVETDSLLAVNAITGGIEIFLEVGEVVECCKQELRKNSSGLLPGWMKSSLKTTGDTNAVDAFSSGGSQENMIGDTLATVLLRDYRHNTEQPQGEESMCNEVFESILSFDKLDATIGKWDPKNHSSHKCSDDNANIKLHVWQLVPG